MSDTILEGKTVEAAEGAATPYDTVPYSICAFPQTHPERLAILGLLLGMTPAPPQRCRVLELGCASGGNLIPMALGAPQSTFVGIDLSGRQIADGRAVARELGVANLELEHLSILDVGEAAGQFDYILAHGVYSWVPPDVQGKILEILRVNLAPQGVGYVSYNTYPGWHARGAIREMLWYHTARCGEPLERVRQSRGLLEFLAKSAAAQDGSYSALIRQELALLRATPDAYLLHEHLEEHNEPLYFHEFAQRAADHALQYLGEAQLSAMVASRLGAETEKTLRQISPDLLHMEQYMDFVRNRMFRQTLLCHAGVKLEHALQPEAVRGFYVASAVKAVKVEAAEVGETGETDLLSAAPREFRGSGTMTLSTQDPLMKAAMTRLSEAWPLPVAFETLLTAARARLGSNGAATADEARQLAARLLHCHAAGLVEFSLSEPHFVAAAGDRPVASPYARLRARQGAKVNNLRLEAILLSDPSRLVLEHLDGRHDRAELTELVARWIEKSGTAPSDNGPAALTPRERARNYVEQILEAFARSALLVG